MLPTISQNIEREAPPDVVSKGWTRFSVFFDDTVLLWYYWFVNKQAKYPGFREKWLCHMKKRIISLILAVCLALMLSVPALGAMSLSNFEKVRTYQGQFTDVSQSAWYYAGVRSVFERGIMDGKSSTVFDPSGRLTLAETIKIAASLHKGFYTGSMDFDAGTPWYAPYVEYALSNDIPVGAYRNLNAAATRSDFALIVGGSLPDEALTPINRIANGAIPDVYESYSYGQAVYRLYRAGVLTGSDNAGTYYPGRTLTRAEAATIIMRVVDASARVPLSLAAELTSEQIYKLASPAVFFVEVLDSAGDVVKTGSGFFISESGLAITNYHVVVGGSSARITMDDGTVIDVAGIYDFDRPTDAAVIQIDGSGFPFLELADSSKLLTGATVYALGSPLGLQASFSRGIVSQALREIEGMKFIQLDAAISSGSSGGALLDSTGRVVGVTSATMLGSQNINLAIPINAFANLSRDKHVPLASIIAVTAHYEDYYPAPDFGSFFDVEEFQSATTWSGITYSYRMSDLPNDAEYYIEEYAHLAEQYLFVDSGYITRDGATYRLYYHLKEDIMMLFGVNEVEGVECFSVILS